MKIKGKETKLFIRASILTAVVLLCSTAVFLGICKSYEEIRRISFGEERSAVFIGKDHIRILDLVIEY
jgi:hypothetical protein